MAAPADPVRLRRANAADIPAMETLIARSARELGGDHYTDAEIEALIAHVFGVDSEVVADGTYFAAECDGALAGCGGWSCRRTLFGGDRFAARESGLLDPASEPAKIRAFFIHPEVARRGIATAILARCEDEARAAGFAALEMMATLPGVPFYAAHAYETVAPVSHATPDGDVRFLHMRKAIGAPR